MGGQGTNYKCEVGRTGELRKGREPNTYLKGDLVLRSDDDEAYSEAARSRMALWLAQRYNRCAKLIAGFPRRFKVLFTASCCIYHDDAHDSHDDTHWLSYECKTE